MLEPSALDTLASIEAWGDTSLNGCGRQKGEQGVGTGLILHMLFTWLGAKATLAQEAHAEGPLNYEVSRNAYGWLVGRLW